MMRIQSILAPLLVLAAVLLSSCVGETPSEQDTPSSAEGERRTINFGIITTESTNTRETNWRPFIAAMSEWTGYDVQPFYASDYAGMIQAMRYGSVQFGWFSNFSGLQAVRLAGGEVFAKATYPDGGEGYHSILLVPVDSPIQSLDDILACDGSIDFGLGDPNSTSGFLVPSAFIFAPRGIDPAECFGSVRNASHEANALAVANELVDVATNNTVNMIVLQRSRPDIYAQLREIWRSPMIQTDPIVWRADLDEEAKRRLQYFFMNYGRMGTPEEVQAARDVLTPLIFGTFLPSSNAHLDPIVQLEIVRDLTETRQDPDLTEEERAARIAELEERLAQVEAGNSGLVSLSEDVNAIADEAGDDAQQAAAPIVSGQAVLALLGTGLLSKCSRAPR